MQLLSGPKCCARPGRRAVDRLFFKSGVEGEKCLRPSSARAALRHRRRRHKRRVASKSASRCSTPISAAIGNSAQFSTHIRAFCKLDTNETEYRLNGSDANAWQRFLGDLRRNATISRFRAPPGCGDWRADTRLRTRAWLSSCNPVLGFVFQMQTTETGWQDDQDEKEDWV